MNTEGLYFFEKDSIPIRFPDGEVFMRIAKNLRGKILLALASGTACFLLIDLSSHIAFSQQLLPSGAPLLLLRGLYLNNRDFIQYNTTCARYDPQLTYTLRPGRCTFSNVEFHTDVFVNSRGLRDDEKSLNKPDIIVLGDSHAMGWGVNQDETFAKILARRTGLTVLNTAISSYGTAREVENVLRLDHSHSKVLIIQYCPNDFEENLAYVANHYKLSPMTKEVYEATSRDIRLPPRYFPGQYLARTVEVQVFHRFARMFLGPARLPDPTGPAPRADSPDYAADLFLKILRHSNLTIGKSLVLVLEVDAFRTTGGFLVAVEQRARQAGMLNLKMVNLNSDLQPKYYFRLDDHINSLGHKLIAERLYQRICHAEDESVRRMCASTL